MFITLLCICFSSFAARSMSRRPVENDVWTEEGDINILNNGRTAKHFIDKKIKEFDSMVTKSQDLSLGFPWFGFKCALCFLASGQRRAVLCGGFGHSGPDAPEVALELVSSQAVLCCQMQQHTNSPEDAECSGNWLWLCQQGTGKYFRKSRHFFTVCLPAYMFSYQGEISQVLALGVKPENIIYAHTTKPQSHIKYACAHAINLMTFDDEDELRKISLHHPKAR